MASRNSAAIGSDEKLLLLILGIIVGLLLILGLLFSVANGVASGLTGILAELGIPAESLEPVYRLVRWGIIGIFLYVLFRLFASR